MKITIFATCYNEKEQLPCFVAHYKTRFPECHIVIWDNYSTDGSREIARELGCEIRDYEFPEGFNEYIHQDLKDRSWKESDTDWNCVQDMDELCDIWQSDLVEEDLAGTSHIKFEGYDMINMSDDPDSIDLESQWGRRNPMYDKTTFVNRKRLTEINWGIGCHTCQPEGQTRKQIRPYKMFHNKYIGLNWILERVRYSSARWSQENKDNKWGVQYLAEESKTKANWLAVKELAKKIR
jgi:hypothetical protein